MIEMENRAMLVCHTERLRPIARLCHRTIHATATRQHFTCYGEKKIGTNKIVDQRRTLSSAVHIGATHTHTPILGNV